jgi:uncharacterized protein with FMN-binding domain
VEVFMKYILFFAAALLIIVSGCAVMAAQFGFGAGVAGGEVFEGTGQGHRGLVTVQVRMDGGSIVEIVIVDSEEDRLVGGNAMEELLDMVIMYNSTDVDVISGATESSGGFLEAVENAILKYHE